tara:strand:+ start:1048 stop:1254 length:207 start_codon:yes stop_codon:yes gene_type:complete
MSIKTEVEEELQWIINLMNDDRMDGFNKFGAKQKLYKIKWTVENALKDAPTFTGEEDWVKENSKLNNI